VRRVTRRLASGRLLFFVAADVDDLAAPVLATALAGAMGEVILATVRALAELRCGQVLMAAAIAAAMAGHFALWYGSHERYAPLFSIVFE
jgi:hypothetical protein